jgi:hypothetical protein
MADIMSYTKPQLISALKRLEKNWPEGYSLFSWSGTLCLMEDDLIEDRSANRHPNGHSSNRSYRDAIVETFSIPNDGGDPD